MANGILDALFKRQAVPSFHGRVPAAQVLHDGHEESAFEPEESYLTLRLSSMYLRNARVLWREFIPFSVVVTDVVFDGAQRSLPFVVGNDLVKKVIDSPLGSGSIEPLNVTVAGPLPYLGSSVGVFVGLFSATANDMSRGLFDTVGELATLSGQGQLSSFLKVAEVVRNGVYRIFDMKEVEFRFGRRDELDPRSTSRNRLQSGYLAFVNKPAREMNENLLWVDNSILKLGRDRQALAPCEDDHCLLAIEHSSERGHFADLEFTATWKTMQRLIWEGQVEKAELFLLPELGKSIVQSPDLTQRDKTAALALYKLKMEAEIERYGEMIGGGKKGKVTRGARDLGDGLGMAPMLQKAAYVADQSPGSRDASRLLRDLADQGAAVLQLDRQPEGPSDPDAGLDAQLAAVRRLQPGTPGTSGQLYDALIADLMDTYSR